MIIKNLNMNEKIELNLNFTPTKINFFVSIHYKNFSIIFGLWSSITVGSLNLNISYKVQEKS